MRKEEGGNRDKLTCVTSGKNGLHFNVLVPVTEEWEEEFIKRNNIEICELYYPPYNFKRSGCLCCPHARDIGTQLETLKRIDPKLYKQAWNIWGNVFKEYKEHNYRIHKEDSYINMNIFDFIEESEE